MTAPRTSPTARAAIAVALLGGLVGGLVGCDTPKPATITERTTKPVALTPAEQAEAVLDRPRAPGEDDGLEVARWSVANNEVLLRRALGRYARRDVALGVAATTLERHGLRAAVLNEEDLARFLIDVGGTTQAVAVWFGQVPAWRELGRTLFESPRVAMVEGKAERLPAGWLRLMTRAWTVPLEEGGYLDVQVAMQLLSDKSDVSGLLNRDVLRGRVWEDAGIHVELPRQTALVLVSAPPESPEAEEDPEGPPPRPDSPGSGPVVELPPTLGEFLLTDVEAKPPRRLVLVLRALLPDILFAPPLPTSPRPGSARPADGDGSPAAPPSEDPPADAP